MLELFDAVRGEASNDDQEKDELDRTTPVPPVAQSEGEARSPDLDLLDSR